MRALLRTLAAAAALTLGASVAAAQAKSPDLTGTWEMDATKSQFGPLPAPAKMTLAITQDGAKTVKIVTTSTSEAGTQTVTSDYAVDGAPHDMTTSDGAKQTSATKWDAGAFVVDTKMERQGIAVGILSRFTVAPDTKLLTVDRHITTPQGEADLKIVFVKK